MKKLLVLALLGMALVFPDQSYALNSPTKLVYKPELIGVTPTKATATTGSPVSIKASYSHKKGYRYIRYAQLLANSSTNTGKCFYGQYRMSDNKVYLMDDSGTRWLGGYAPGSRKTIENSYVRIDCSKVKVAGSGTSLSVTWPATFKETFAAATPDKNVYLYASDTSGASNGLTQKGTILLGGSSLVADFVGTPVSGESPLDVQFTDKSTGTIDRYSWNFGDGTASTETNPTHTYSITGMWQINYEADLMPDQPGAGWTRSAEEPVVTEAVEAGILHIKTSQLEGGRISYSRTADFSSTNEYTVEARVKIGEFGSVTYADMCVSAYDDRYAWRLDLSPGGVNLGWSATYSGGYEMDTTSDYHTYRVVALNGTVTVFVDGIQRITADMRRTDGHGYPSSVTFGQLVRYSTVYPQPSRYTEAFWDYLKIDNKANRTQGNIKYFPVSLTVYNSSGGYSTKTKDGYIQVLGKKIEIFTEGLVDGIVSNAYSQTMYADNSIGLATWSIESGSLPPGLYLDGNSGRISGSPYQPGSYSFTVGATDGRMRHDTQDLTINVLPYPPRTDLELFIETEAKAASYFYYEALSNGFVRDSSGTNIGSIGATGFGLAALCVLAENGAYENKYYTIKPDQARARVNQILDNCILYQNSQTPTGNNYGYGGFLYHFVNADGTRYGTRELSTVDMALFMAGAVVAGEYFGGEVRDKVNAIYDKLQWRLFLNPYVDRFSHGWTPENGLISTTWDRPGDETILVSIMALGKEPDAQDFLETMYSWPRVERQYGGYRVTNSYFGSLFTYFFAHCFIDFERLGFDNPSATKYSSARPVDWWQNSVQAVYADRQFCIDNAATYSSYSPDSWGITACEAPWPAYLGLIGAAPCEYNNSTPSHCGVIAPYGAISSMPLMRTSPGEALADNLAFRALKHYYTTYYKNLWGKYGPSESFDNYNRFCRSYLGIDVGPEVLMMENYFTGLIWNCFMKSPRMNTALNKIFPNRS